MRDYAHAPDPRVDILAGARDAAAEQARRAGWGVRIPVMAEVEPDPPASTGPDTGAELVAQAVEPAGEFAPVDPLAQAAAEWRAQEERVRLIQDCPDGVRYEMIRPERKRRPSVSPVWGIASLVASCSGVAMISAVQLVWESIPRPLLVVQRGMVELAGVLSVLAGLFLGLMGRRSRDGRRWAVWGETIAWATPTLALVNESLSDWLHWGRAIDLEELGTLALSALLIAGFTALVAVLINAPIDNAMESRR